MKLLILLALGIIAACPLFADHTLGNGYFQLHAREGWFDVLSLDPSGKGKYGDNLIKSLSMGEIPEGVSGFKIEQSEKSLSFRGLPVRMPFKTEQMYSTHAVELTGVSLGVKFTAPAGWITSVGGKFPTWHQTDSGCVLRLYRVPDGDMAKKELVAGRKLANVPDNSTQFVECKPQPPGVYYLEISEKVGTHIGWWGSGGNVTPSMTAYVDGVEHPEMDLTLVYSGYNEFPADWTVTLDGPNLTCSLKPAGEGAQLPAEMHVRMVTPWEKAGYDVSKFPFSRFYTDTGRHMLVQQLKRRPHSDQLQAGKWICAMGRKSFDLRFNLSPGQRLSWQFDDDAMTWRFNGPGFDIDLLPHSSKLPDYYPVFYSSEPKFDKVLNEFYYSHALNFGVGTPADWKEWQALILDWTANPQRDEQRGHFTGMSMRPDGYVYTWGGQEGWPFPYKDEDRDGKNDYDTRHFTTNPCFILGAYRYFVWTGDVEFLKEIMPKLRSAMAFQLDQLQGRRGIIIIDAKGHEGRAEGIGSNYWDILPFGYKDAFCNSYYYASIQAMAELEQFCIDQQLDLSGPKESPAYYQALRPRARKAYNRDFWDEGKGRYVGCVDVDGVKHDYGFTFVNVEAMAYGLADEEQAKRVYNWMETDKTSSGKADTYTKWIFAPRANTIHNPPRDKPQEPAPSWWHFGWGGTPYGDQCQDGGAILYTSYYDIVARAKFLGADNAFKRYSEILGRYNKPDRLCGGSPLYFGEDPQGGPGGHAGSVGVEGEFPESGLVPSAFLYAFLGVNADIEGLKIRPNLPSALNWAGVKNLSYAGNMYDIKVTNDSVEISVLGLAKPFKIEKALKPGETFVLRRGMLKAADP